MRIRLTAAFAYAVLAVAGGFANAGVIYDGGIPDTNESGSISDLDFNPSFLTAESFSLSAQAATITDIHWWGYYNNGDDPGSPGTDDFSIRVYGDNGGNPDSGNILLDINPGSANRTDTGLDNVNSAYGDLYSHSVDIAPLDLADSTTYYASIFNNTTAGGTGIWAWAATDANGTRWIGSVSWNSFNSGSLAFNLTDDLIP
jgi:hypothetical protein